MNDLDLIAPHFCLAKARWPDARALAKHYESVVESYRGNSYGLIATIKSFVESVCLTILGEFGKVPASGTPNTTELLVEALRCLGLQNSRGASKVDRLLSAHNKMTDVLSEIRNEGCPLAHGKDGFLDALTNNERRAFLITADTLLALLLSALNGTEPDLQYTREPYERFDYLHERIDRSVAMEVETEDSGEQQILVVRLRTGCLPEEGVELRIEPSRLLYAIDRTAYVEFLTSTGAVTGNENSSEQLSFGEESMELRRAPKPSPPLAETVILYDGVLAPLKDSLNQFLTANLKSESVGPALEGLPDSLLKAAEPHLGLDWNSREPLIAALKVALRRTLVRYGFDRRLTDVNVERLLSWFKDNARMESGALNSKASKPRKRKR